MDKYLCRKDVLGEIEKAMRDRSHLTQKVITDKNGNQRKVWVKPGENPVADKGKKVEENTEKTSAKPKYSVGDKVTLDGAKGDFKVSSIDKDGAYHVVSVDGKTGYKVSENHINGSEKVSLGNREMTDDNKKVSDKLDEITSKLDKEKDFTKRKELLNQMKDIQANGTKSKYFASKEDKIAGEFEKQMQKDNTDIKENNLIEKLSNKVEFTDEQKKAINNIFSAGDYKEGDAGKLLNDLYYDNKDVYNQLTNMNNQIWEESKEKSKTYSSLDLIKEKINTLLKDKQFSKTDERDFNVMSDKEFFDKYKDMIPSEGRYGTPETRKEDIKKEIEFQEYMKNNGSSGYSKNKHDILKEALKRLEGSNKKEVESEKKEQPKKQVSFEVQQNRKQQQKKEKEKYDYNKRMDDFYKNTGLDGGPDAVLYRQAVEKEENKQSNLRAGSRDDSIFNENDDVTFWRSGNYIDGKITQVKEDYRGTVSLQIESNGNKYWVETENIIKHPASAK